MFIKTLIRVSKSNQKIPNHPNDMSNMQTGFLASGIFPRSASCHQGKYLDTDIFFLKVLVTRFWVPKMKLTQSHTSPFWDLYYIDCSYPLV